MKFLAILSALIIELTASNLLTYNIYERSDRVDVMLSFDAPYQGNIFQKHENDMTMLIFNGLSFDQAVDKNINSKILQELYIEPKQNSVVLSIKSSSQIAVNASKTADGFGLRVRVTNAPIGSNLNINAKSQNSAIPTESSAAGEYESDQTQTYLILCGLLGLITLLWVMKSYISRRARIINGDNEPKPEIITPEEPVKPTNLGSWLVKDGNAQVEIIYERMLDDRNKVVLLTHQNKRYLVLVGSSNVLLDKFGEEKIQSEEDFQAFFEENKKKLGQYLQNRQNSLNSYKDKASMD